MYILCALVCTLLCTVAFLLHICLVCKLYLFSTGFWAGITVECTDDAGVELDLNGHTLQMSKAFYYQQSFFVHIALSEQIFLPGQGPGMSVFVCTNCNYKFWLDLQYSLLMFDM